MGVNVVWCFLLCLRKRLTVPEERSAELWPRTGPLAGEVGRGRRSRRVQWEGPLAPRTGCSSAPENRRQWCATSPGTANIQVTRRVKQAQRCDGSSAELTRLQSTPCLLVAKVTGAEEDRVLNLRRPLGETPRSSPCGLLLVRYYRVNTREREHTSTHIKGLKS